MQEAEQEGQVRLQKFLARAGVASRRASEKLIEAGRVSVNGQVVTELGTKVDPEADEVRLDGAPVCKAAEAVTLMLNKPAGYLTSMKDPQGRPCVAQLVPLAEFPAFSCFPPTASWETPCSIPRITLIRRTALW